MLYKTLTHTIFQFYMKILKIYGNTYSSIRNVRSTGTADCTLGSIDLPHW